MVHVGAKGDTAKQLKKALGLGKFSDQEIHGTIGNRIKSAKVLLISYKCIIWKIHMMDYIFRVITMLC